MAVSLPLPELTVASAPMRAKRSRSCIHTDDGAGLVARPLPCKARGGVMRKSFADASRGGSAATTPSSASNGLNRNPVPLSAPPLLHAEAGYVRQFRLHQAARGGSAGASAVRCD